MRFNKRIRTTYCSDPGSLYKGGRWGSERKKKNTVSKSPQRERTTRLWSPSNISAGKETLALMSPEARLTGKQQLAFSMYKPKLKCNYPAVGSGLRLLTPGSHQSISVMHLVPFSSCLRPASLTPQHSLCCSNLHTESEPTMKAMSILRLVTMVTQIAMLCCRRWVSQWMQLSLVKCLRCVILCVRAHILPPWRSWQVQERAELENDFH